MGRYYTVVGGARGVPVQPVTIEEIIRIRKNPRIRLTTSPFGLTEEQLEKGLKVLYGSGAVPWKGIKGKKFWEFAEEYVNKKGEKGTLAKGLRNAIAISREYAGIKGVGIAPDGRIMPKKAIAQMLKTKEV